MASMMDFMPQGSTSPSNNALALGTGQGVMSPFTQSLGGLHQSQNLYNFQNEALPALMNQGVARGQWGSSGLSQRESNLAGHVSQTNQDIQLGTLLPDLVRNRVQAATGVMV